MTHLRPAGSPSLRTAVFTLWSAALGPTLLPAQTTGSQPFPKIPYCIRGVADPSIAVSTMAVVHTVNSQIAIYNPVTFSFRATQYLDINPSGSGLLTLFGPVGGTRIVDTKVLYDQNTQRFYVVGLQMDAPTAPPGVQGIYVACSESNNPSLHTQPFLPPPSGANWRRFPTSIAGLTVLGVPVKPDYNGLGIDDTRLVYSGALFDSALAARGHLFRIFQTSQLLAGPAPVPVDRIIANRPPLELPQPAHVFGSSSNLYLVGVGSTSTVLRVTAIDAANVVHESLVPVPSFVLPGVGAGAPQASSIPPTPFPIQLDVLDGRIQNAVVRDGVLWTCHTVWSSATGGGKSVVRWYEIALNGFPSGGTPTLIESGTVDPGNNTANNPISAFYPAIMPDTFGNAGLFFGASALDEGPSVWRAGKVLNSAPGTFGTYTRIFGGPGGVGILGPNGTARWGDYFSIALDPLVLDRFYAAGTHAYSSGVPAYCNPAGSSTWESVLTWFSVNDPGSVTAFGVGAPGTILSPPVTPFHVPVTGTARLGSTVQLLVQNSTSIGVGAPGIWVLATAVASPPVPVFNGLLFPDPATAALLSFTHSTAVAETLSLPIPFDPALVNSHVFSQCVNFDVNFDTSFTAALDIRIGLP